VTDSSRAVFLSYASQDAEAALQLCNALRQAGVEVWFDQSELRGGDAWDASIRRQIKNCYLFVAIISANTQSREEGYFRREWKLAVDRTNDMAEGRAFILPVIIDGTSDARALVPEKFREVQWTRLPAVTNAESFVEHVRRLLTPDAARPFGESVGPSARPQLLTAISSTRSPPRSSRPLMLWAVGAGVILVIGYLIANGIMASKSSAPTTQTAAMITPYSAEDRRMTFALLPLRTANDDPIGVNVATATGNAVFKSLEENHYWVQLESQASVANALTHYAVPHEVAKAMNVHFLFRGSVARDTSGYTVSLFVIDGESERVLGSKTLLIPPGALVPRSLEDIDDATGFLVFYALQSEVARARNKPDAALDVRDLTFRAFFDWGDQRLAGEGKSAYLGATELLNRALVLAPDDPLALKVTAKINLCDCVEAWSPNVADQQAIAEKALDRFLSAHPDDAGMLHEKANLYAARGRFRESLLILDSILERHSGNSSVTEDKAFALLKLGRPNEAAAPAAAAYAAHDRPNRAALLAAIDYENMDYPDAERLAQKAITGMSNGELGNSRDGTVRLTLIAAAARLRQEADMRAALSDLKGSVPALTSISAVRKWMNPHSNLYGYEPLFEGLRLAGLND
jgi:tetratricopeptide (TPR) repeat protein